MKIYLTIFLIALLSSSSFAQQNSKPKVTVNFFANNFCTRGIDNHIIVMAENTPCKDLIIKASNGVLKKAEDENDCSYYFRPDTISNSATISVYKLVNQQPILLGEFQFRIYGFPMPTTKIGNLHYGEMECKYLMAQSGISAVIEGTDFDCPCKITLYTFQVIRNSKSIFLEEYVEGNLFNDNIKAFLSKIKSGDRVIVFGIDGICCDKVEEGLDAIELLMK